MNVSGSVARNSHEKTILKLDNHLMEYSYYDSSLLSSILTWFVMGPVMAGGLMYLFSFVIIPFLPKIPAGFLPTGITKPVLFWAVLCIYVLSPARYALFQLVLIGSYPLQSFSAWLGFMFLCPLYFGGFFLLCLVGFAAPCLTFAIFVKGQNWVRSLVWAVLFPLACLLGEFLYFAALPYGAIPLKTAIPRELIRAANGPAAFVFNYLVPKLPLNIPDIYEYTPMTQTDLLRCHVADTYLTNNSFEFFIHKQYPNLVIPNK